MKRLLIDRAIFNLQSSGGISTLWRSLLPYLATALEGWEIVDSLPADVFISTYYQPAPAGIPSIAIVYDFIAQRYPLLSSHTIDSQWKYAAIENASAVIAISQWTADDVLRYQGKQASVAYPATSLHRAKQSEVLAFKAKYGIQSAYVLISGRRDLYKNVSTYWQACRMMTPPPLTVCIGGEPMASNSHVLHIDLDASELTAAYTGAMCLVYPSLYEGFGLPVLEAYSCGCPVICGNGGALAEINEAACVVDVTRPREIAQALVTLMNPSERMSYILKGYDVAKRFSWQAMAEQIASVVRDVVERVEI